MACKSGGGGADLAPLFSLSCLHTPHISRGRFLQPPRPARGRMECIFHPDNTHARIDHLRPQGEWSSSPESPRPQHHALVPTQAAVVTHEPAPASRRASHALLVADAYGLGEAEQIPLGPAGAKRKIEPVIVSSFVCPCPLINVYHQNCIFLWKNNIKYPVISNPQPEYLPLLPFYSFGILWKRIVRQLLELGSYAVAKFFITTFEISFGFVAQMYLKMHSFSPLQIFQLYSFPPLKFPHSFL